MAITKLDISMLEDVSGANNLVKLDANAKIPAGTGANLLNKPGPTKSASDPAIDSNKALGAEWLNTTDGEMFICTDATAGANVWTNVGAGTGDVEPVPPAWEAAGENYGYVQGSVPNSGAPGTRIEKFSFTSDGNSTDLADLLTGRIYAASSKSTTHGYLAGGDIPATTNVISKFAFVSTVNATDVGDITGARRMGGGTTSQTHGYIVSGNDLDKIDKWAHASDGNASDVGNLTESKFSVTAAHY